MAKLVPKQTLEEVRFRNEISDVIGSYIAIQRAGTNFKALCPFHKEKTPSFNINTQRQIFHCFGCGAGGDVFGFVMEHEGVDFMGAVSLLADRVGIVLELEEGEAGKGPDKRKLFRIHEEISRFYQRCLREIPGAQHARDYVKERSLDDAVAEEFVVGYAPDSWDAVLRWGRKHEIHVEDLVACGLVIASDKPGSRSSHYDRFRDRLMFPIHDAQGRVIGFSGRALKEDQKSAKYINSPETPLFRKSRVLYAIHRARQSIVEAREAVLCEGQIDVIRCHQQGLETAIAAQGTAFTEEHAKSLRHYADSVVVLFDSDSAGQDAAIKTADLLIESEYSVRVARLPPGHDPDSLIREHGIDELQSILSRAASSVNFQIEVLSERWSGAAGRLRVTNAVLASVARAPKEVQKEQLLQEAAEKLNLPLEALRKDLQTLKAGVRRPRRADTPKPAPPVQADAPPPQVEIALCEHLLQLTDTPEQVAELRRYLPLSMISHGDCRRLAGACLKSLETGQDVMQVLAEIGEMSDNLQRLSASVLNAPPKLTGETFSRADAVRDLILDIWRRKLRSDRRAIDQNAGADMTREETGRRHQLTHDLTLLRSWDEGAETIELILEDM